MARLLSYFIPLLCMITLVSACSSFQEPEISKENANRILKTLSSDGMKGRYTFSPEIGKAADFISTEFNSIGLKPLPELGSYRQTFNLFSISQDSASVTIDGKIIGADHFFALPDAEMISWNTGDVSVFEISVNDNFKNIFNDFKNDSLSSVVLVDPAHLELFNRYRRYYSRPTRKFELGNEYSDVFVLYDGKGNTFEINFKNKVKEHELFNVAGMIEGKRTDEIILFSAHYDHIGITRPIESDSIGNGANDNASGTTAVIELARYFKALPKPERTLYFVTFTAEEVGGYGSKYFSRQLEPEQIIAMFNIEMIGKPAVEGTNSAWITGFEKSNFGKLLQQSCSDSLYKFYPDPYTTQNLFYRSDNATLARLGVPAHTISTTPIDVDTDYHTATDEYETINISHMTNTIRAIARAARGMVSGKDTPSRIDKSQVN